jgi:hypothetical protein
LGITPIGRHGLIAIRAMTQGAYRSQKGEKINPTGLE